MLRQIAANTEGNSEADEESESCGANAYKVGDKCVTFPSKDSPEINDLDTTELNAKIEEAKTELEGLFNQIKTDTSNLFSISGTSGTYQSRPVTFKGVNYDLTLQNVLSQFNIGAIVIFICSLLSLFIILGSRNG